MKAVKIALYESVYGTVQPNKVEKWIEEDKDYVRVSHSVKVKFEMLSEADVVNDKVASIDKQITDIQASTENQITKLTRRRNELLALPNPGESHE